MQLAGPSHAPGQPDGQIMALIVKHLNLQPQVGNQQVWTSLLPLERENITLVLSNS